MPVERASSAVQQIGRLLKASKVRQGSETSPRVGDATVTDSKITFAGVQSTDRACLDPGSQSEWPVSSITRSQARLITRSEGTNSSSPDKETRLLVYTPGR